MMEEETLEGHYAELTDRIDALSSELSPLETDAVPNFEKASGIKAVLFDVYGTLFISASGDIAAGAAGDGEESFITALRDSGLDMLAPPSEDDGSELLNACILADHEKRRSEGIEYPEVDILAIWHQVLEQLSKRQSLCASFSLRTLATLAVCYECRVNPVWPMPGLRDTLSALRATGLKMGIVSNAQFYTPLMFHAFLDAVPEELGFDPACCAWSYKFGEGKPSRTLFKNALKALQNRHGIKPQQTLYVGNDMLKDIWPAHACGCRTVLFAGDRRSLRLRKDDSRCSAVKPDFVITRLEQLIDICTTG